MADILIRGLDPKLVAQLKERAKRHKRSLQSEVKLLLEQSAGSGPEEMARMIERWKKRFAGRPLKSSVEMIREDRER